MVNKSNEGNSSSDGNRGKKPVFSLEDYLLVFQKLPLSLIITDDDFIVTDLNAKAVKEFGLTAEFKGKSLLDLFKTDNNVSKDMLLEHAVSSKPLEVSLESDNTKDVTVEIQSLTANAFLVTLRRLPTDSLPETIDNKSEAIAQIGMLLLQDSITPIDVSRMVQQYLREYTKSPLSLIYVPSESNSGFTLFNHSSGEEMYSVYPEEGQVEQLKFFKQHAENSEPIVYNEPIKTYLPGFSDNETELERMISIPAFTGDKLTSILILGNSREQYDHETVATAQRFIHMFSLALYKLKAEETLQDAKERAEESDRLKSLFLSNMSHEIRTPMNAIVGFAEMLQDSDLDREQKNRFLDVIIKSGDNLLRLINDIIDISKIEAGQLKFVYSDCLVNEMVGDLETYFKQEVVRLKKQHLEIFTQLGHPDSDFAICTDVDRVKQVLNNLIGNAIKFTDDGFIEFGYRLNAGFIEFYVRDSGIGIAPDKQEVIFERFGQVREAVSRNQTGTGLGLTISKNIVERLGGTIWVDSYPGEGSTFYFSLPMRKSTSKTTVPAAGPIDVKSNSLDFKGKTILVVEDVDTNYLYLNSLLSKHNCKVIRATNGMKAIELCQQDSSIDLVLMDIELPILNGYKATTEIKKFRPNLPIIAQTAFAMTGERERSREAGCDDYLSKPIRKEDLLAMVTKYI